MKMANTRFHELKHAKLIRKVYKILASYLQPIRRLCTDEKGEFLCSWRILQKERERNLGDAPNSLLFQDTSHSKYPYLPSKKVFCIIQELFTFTFYSM